MMQMFATRRFQRYARLCQRAITTAQSRTYNSSPAWRIASDNNHNIDLEDLLSEPTWSVASLLPSETSQHDAPDVTPKQLHHLLRLSALPPPRNEAEEKKMLSTLSAQLHFVKEIQKVNTSGVEPLRSLRDETAQGEKEAELGIDALQDALAKEEIRGKHHKRIRRKQERLSEVNATKWDVLGSTSKKTGRYFVVEGGKGP